MVVQLFVHVRLALALVVLAGGRLCEAQGDTIDKRIALINEAAEALEREIGLQPEKNDVLLNRLLAMHPKYHRADAPEFDISLGRLLRVHLELYKRRDDPQFAKDKWSKLMTESEKRAVDLPRSVILRWIAFELYIELYGEESLKLGETQAGDPKWKQFLRDGTIE